MSQRVPDSDVECARHTLDAASVLTAHGSRLPDRSPDTAPPSRVRESIKHVLPDRFRIERVQRRSRSATSSSSVSPSAPLDGVTISGSAPRRVASTGVPLTIASIAASPNGSFHCPGIQRQAARASSSSSAPRRPARASARPAAAPAATRPPCRSAGGHGGRREPPTATLHRVHPAEIEVAFALPDRVEAVFGGIEAVVYPPRDAVAARHDRATGRWRCGVDTAGRAAVAVQGPEVRHVRSADAQRHVRVHDVGTARHIGREIGAPRRRRGFRIEGDDSGFGNITSGGGNQCDLGAEFREAPRQPHHDALKATIAADGNAGGMIQDDVHRYAVSIERADHVPRPARSRRHNCATGAGSRG